MLFRSITTILDWSHIQATREHGDAVIKALQESGMRAVFAYGYPSWKEPDANQDAWIREIVKQYFSSKDGLLTFAIAPQGPEFTPFDVAKSQWMLARELGARITVHVGVGMAGKRGKLAEMGKAGLLKEATTPMACAPRTATATRRISASTWSASVAPASAPTRA